MVIDFIVAGGVTDGNVTDGNFTRSQRLEIVRSSVIQVGPPCESVSNAVRKFGSD
eukprot:CAMPEP_0169371028 /NCGR_PEP_ID=MMETSP1017-20121227/35667_1 /TAXON_ID=342587 /ORGANISM="Karlodinium micrum, Strain CCMP2283" /LENGTH=54 /DNA_ID=CAMNT_0009469475 /DNA_START=85 /DNA_END=246 /DNA_ORIENTATION=+